MTMTETRPSGAAADPAPTATSDSESAAGGLAALFGSGDPTVVGRLWIGASLAFLVLAGGLGAALGIERLDTSTYDVFTRDHFAQAFSMHAVVGIFLAAIPLFIGVGTIVVPRQLGIRTVAFPRAMSFAFWAWLLSGVMVVVAYLVNGGPGGSSQDGVDLFLVSLALVAVALVVASISLATTVLALRRPGMTLARVPAFAWSMLVAATMWIANLSVLAGLLGLLYVDARYKLGAVDKLQGSLDGWLRWTASQPALYVAAIPVLGVAFDIIPVFTDHRQKRHGVILGAIGLYGALTFGAWSFYQVHAANLTRQALYVGMGIAIVLPVLLLLGALGESLVKGKVRFAPPLLFGVSAFLFVLDSAVLGGLRVIDPFKLVGTTADAGVAHSTLAATLMGAIAALHYWWPQITGRSLHSVLGTVSGLLGLVGATALAIPDIISGFMDESRGSLGRFDDTIKALNAVSLAGGIILLFAIVVFLLNLADSLTRPEEDGTTDPWDGFTLEWADDPAAVAVASATPLLDQKETS